VAAVEKAIADAETLTQEQLFEKAAKELGDERPAQDSCDNKPRWQRRGQECIHCEASKIRCQHHRSVKVRHHRRWHDITPSLIAEINSGRHRWLQRRDRPRWLSAPDQRPRYQVLQELCSEGVERSLVSMSPIPPTRSPSNTTSRLGCTTTRTTPRSITFGMSLPQIQGQDRHDEPEQRKRQHGLAHPAHRQGSGRCS
jgi:hypothetical protein